MPYAKIGASIQQQQFWSIVMKGCFFCLHFESGCTQILWAGDKISHYCNILHTKTKINWRLHVT